MNKKIITTLSSVLLIIGLTGCKQQEQISIKEEVGTKEETKADFTISNGYVDLKSEDLEIVKWSYSAKEPSNPDKNSANFMGDVTMGGKGYMSKKAVIVVELKKVRK